ncbi:MAG: hypothetical protein HC828_04125 [Blastochloris sp.]|nr:hypothetical protein [Blastochloris sp.]
MIFHRVWITVLVLMLLSARAAPALAHGSGPQQIVDGFQVTLVEPEKGWFTGDNQVDVILWSALGHPVEAQVSILPLAYTPQSDGHGAARGADADAHGDNHSDDGQGIVADPVALFSGAEADMYSGALRFDQPGTWTVGVVFVVDGVERGAIFDLNVAQSRPRGLVLGGFALLNALAIGTAAWLKYRTSQKPTRAPAQSTSSNS